MTKGGDVTKERKEKCDQNSWFSIIFMTLYFMFVFVTRNLICSNAEQGGSSDKLFASQVIKDGEQFFYAKLEHTYHLTEESGLEMNLFQAEELGWSVWLK